MKKAVFVLLLTFWCSQLYAGDLIPWWLFDNSDPASTRFGNVRAASKIVTDGGVVSLLAERDGALVPFFESRHPKTIDQAKQQIQMAPSVCILVTDGGHVMMDSIASIRIERKDGLETYVLRGLSTDLGIVTDAQNIKRLKAQLNFQ